MKKVLVGVDLNATYVWLVVRAAALAKGIGAQVDLLYATEELSDKGKKDHERALSRLLENVDADERGSPIVKQGKPAEVLHEMSSDYDILVVGPREPEGWKRLVEKPMAVQVIASARCPVFIPRTEAPRSSFPQILLGVDLSRREFVDRLAVAAKWAPMLGGKLDAVYCEADPTRPLVSQVAGAAAGQHWKAQRLEALADLQARMEKALDASARGEALMREENPDSALVELSKEYDLVMVGTADIASTGFLMGSVAVDVVRHAHCDVMTLPG